MGAGSSAREAGVRLDSFVVLVAAQHESAEVRALIELLQAHGSATSVVICAREELERFVRERREREAGEVSRAIGRYLLDEHGNLLDGSRAIRLSAGERAVLMLLMNRANAWISAAELARVALRRSDSHGESLVRQYIFRLRRKLGMEHAMLRHSRGQGYQLLMTSQCCSNAELTPQSAERESLSL